MRNRRTLALPPFFTHTIGSLPRPKVLLDLLGKRAEIPDDRFEAFMDEMVVFAIRVQEQAGINVIGDGEWRRTHYIGEFLNRVGGCERCRKFEHQGEMKYTDVFVRRMEATEPVFQRDAQFLVQHTDRVTKFALPSPFLIAVRYWHQDYSTGAYPTYRHLMGDLTERLQLEARALVEAGIDIVQIDDPAITYFCDRRLTSGREIHDERLRREWRIEEELPAAVEAVNRVLADLPVETHLHCCHSVYKRQSDVIGDYKPVLPFFEDLNVDRVNLEFAYQGTGRVDDLGLLPSHLCVGLGVVDVRGERIQTVQEMASIASAGAAVIAPERIALNPDCGFAPDAGEPPTVDEAFEKLKRLAEAADLVRCAGL